MQYQIQGQPYPVAVLTLQPEESVLCQKGAMSWMTPNMEMATKGGGLGKMFSRALTGEAMFQNQYTAKGGTGMIAFSSALPGEIMPVAITPERPIVAQKSAFLASEAGVSFELYFQKKIAGGFFGGEGFIMQKFSGNGMLFLEIDGSTMAYDCSLPRKTQKTDTQNEKNAPEHHVQERFLLPINGVLPLFYPFNFSSILATCRKICLSVSLLLVSFSVSSFGLSVVVVAFFANPFSPAALMIAG